MKFEIEGEESRRLLVKKQGNGGYTYLPASWIGREIEVVLLPEKKAKINCNFYNKNNVNENLNYELGFENLDFDDFDIDKLKSDVENIEYELDIEMKTKFGFIKLKNSNLQELEVLMKISDSNEIVSIDLYFYI